MRFYYCCHAMASAPVILLHCLLRVLILRTIGFISSSKKLEMHGKWNFPEVKDALQKYIQLVRPEIPECPNVFLTAQIPYKPLDCNAINTAVWSLVGKASVNTCEKKHGSRAFRSSLASNMVNDNVPTEVVRKVLGHGTKHAIRHYTRLDIESMRICPLTSPEPSGSFAEMLSWKDGEHHV